MRWADRIFARVAHEASFTAGQRRAILFLLILAVAVGGYRLYRDRATIPNPQPSRGDRAAELADRIDPNTAEASDLAVLPSLGLKRAKAIVAYRDATKAADPAAIPFRREQDLYRVKGVGPALVELMRPYLIFPATQPATMPN